MTKPGVIVAVILCAVSSTCLSAQEKVSGDFQFDGGTVFTLGSGGDAGRVGSALGWRCVGSRLEVVYGWDQAFEGHGEMVRVSFSVDDGDPVSMYWRMQSNRRSAIMPHKFVASFTAAAKNGRTALLGARDEDGTTVLDAFGLMGLRRSLGRLPCAP